MRHTPYWAFLKTPFLYFICTLRYTPYDSHAETPARSSEEEKPLISRRLFRTDRREMPGLKPLRFREQVCGLYRMPRNTDSCLDNPLSTHGQSVGSYYNTHNFIRVITVADKGK